MMIKTLLLYYKKLVQLVTTNRHQKSDDSKYLQDPSQTQSTEPKPVPGPPLDGSQQRHP